MKYELKTYENQPFFYLRRVGEYGVGNIEVMERLKKKLIENNLMNEQITIYGIAQDNPMVTAVNKCRYDVGIVGEISDPLVHKIGLEKGYILGGLYLEFTITHTEDGVRSFWETFPVALEKSKFLLDEKRVILEQYPLTLVKKGFCKMCVPIKQSN